MCGCVGVWVCLFWPLKRNEGELTPTPEGILSHGGGGGGEGCVGVWVCGCVGVWVCVCLSGKGTFIYRTVKCTSHAYYNARRYLVLVRLSGCVGWRCRFCKSMPT